MAQSAYWESGTPQPASYLHVFEKHWNWSGKDGVQKWSTGGVWASSEGSANGFPLHSRPAGQLQVERSNYLRALYGYTDSASKTRTLDDFQYPDGAPFTIVKFKFALLVSNAFPMSLCLYKCLRRPFPMIVFLNSMISSGLSFSTASLETSIFAKSTVYWWIMANALGWDRFRRAVCAQYFLPRNWAALRRQLIYQSISSWKQNRFISTSSRLKFKFFNVRAVIFGLCTGNIFQKQRAHSVLQRLSTADVCSTVAKK